MLSSSRPEATDWLTDTFNSYQKPLETFMSPETFEFLDNFNNNSLKWDIEPTLTRPDLPGNTLTEHKNNHAEI